MGSYVYFKKMSHVQDTVSIVELIPQNLTSEIIEITSPAKNLEELFRANLIWKEIENKSKLKRLEYFWDQSDSVFNEIKNDALVLVSFVNNENKDEYFILEFKESPLLFNSKSWKTKVIGNFLLLTQGSGFSVFNESKKIAETNQSNFISIFNSRGQGESKINVFQRKGSNWSVFDLTFLPEQIFTNGFVRNTSQSNELNSSIDLSVFSLIPSEFESIKLIHFDSTEQLRKDNDYLKLKTEACKCDLNHSAYSWIESPSVYFKSQYQSASYVLFKLTSIVDFKYNINNMLPDSLVMKEDDNLVIRAFDNAFDYNSIFRTNMNFNYFVRVNDYVMFSEEKIHLERLLFQQFSNLTIENKKDLSLYLKNSINKKSKEITISGGLNYWDFDLKSGIGISQSHIESKELVYESMLYTKEINLDGGKTNPKWNLEFSIPLFKKIYLVNNHRTNDKDYLVQDKKNTLYFITPNGVIKWKKDIENPIVGNVKNIDILGNDKYQLIFNTKNKLYILDVLGRNVENFPVKILDSATANVSIMDYEKDLNFRFLVPTTQGIKSINKQGQIVKGWSQPKQTSEVLVDINHLLINNLDYIQVQDSKGKLYFYNRKGEVRHTVSSTFNNEIYILQGSSIEQTRAIYFDSVSNSIKRQFFSDKAVSILLSPEAKIKEFFFVDYNKDNNSNFVLVFENEVKIYGQDLIIQKRLELPSNITQFEIWKGGYGFLNQFDDFTITQGQDVKVIEEVNGYRIDFYKDKVRAIIKGDNNLKLIHI
ncbi:MAG: hypothetical protein ACI8RY_001649 [Urechidicola sp.]|jgi:hypothetical protein